MIISLCMIKKKHTQHSHKRKHYHAYINNITSIKASTQKHMQTLKSRSIDADHIYFNESGVMIRILSCTNKKQQPVLECIRFLLVGLHVVGWFIHSQSFGEYNYTQLVRYIASRMTNYKFTQSQQIIPFIHHPRL